MFEGDELKRVHKSDEPWKKLEPNGRLTREQEFSQNQSLKEKNAMEQRIKVIFWRELFLPGFYKSATLKFKIPLKTDELSEVMEKLNVAFPHQLEFVEGK